MSETKRLVFLDIDGPMCTPRAVMASGAIGVTRYFDPVAVGFLNQLYVAVPYRIVVTSTWRKEVYMPTVLAACGILAPCHDDWATSDDQVEGSKNSMDDRPYQINQWMNDHGYLILKEAPLFPESDEKYSFYTTKENVKVLIIDDDSFNWHTWQLDRWVKADSYDGIPLMQMQRAFDLWEVEWPAKNRAYPA